MDNHDGHLPNCRLFLQAVFVNLAKRDNNGLDIRMASEPDAYKIKVITLGHDNRSHTKTSTCNPSTLGM